MSWSTNWKARCTGSLHSLWGKSSRGRMFPFAFRALDFAVFWCHNATQSGRMENRISMKWNGYGLKQVEF